MATEIRMPQLGLTMTEGVIGGWLKNEGDTIKKGEALLQVETDKITNQIESEAEGTILSIAANEGDTVPVQGLLCIVGQPDEKIEAFQANAVKEPTPTEGASIPVLSKKEVSKQGNRIKISPLAKKMAIAMNIKYEGITGSGPGGRIVQKDILGYTGRIQQQQNDEIDPEEKRVKMKGMRRVIAERMLKAHTEIPSVTQNMKIDVTELMQLREKVNEGRENRFSVNDFILLATAKALAANKNILVSLDGEEAVYHEHVNIGMAVSTPDGLITPVIRDIDKMGLEALSSAARDFALRAREGKLEVHEYKGSTFTVSNLGMFGIETFTPIINQPEAAILGVCTIEDELALAEAAVSVRKKMRISLTYDHRLIDGAEAARFQMAIRELIEHPLNIFLA